MLKVGKELPHCHLIDCIQSCGYVSLIIQKLAQGVYKETDYARKSVQGCSYNISDCIWATMDV